MPSYRAPAGFYQAPGIPYPRPPMPTDPDRNRDLLGGVVDPAMEPDAGVGAAPPRDPFMASLPPVADRASAAAITRLQPNRTSPFTGRDAQALAVLDPRALAEANALAPLDQPKTMTASFGGKDFEMTPAARVGRNELAQIYNKYQGIQGQERADKVRGQEQGHRERLVSIPGEQGITKRGMELGTEERMGLADRTFRTPTRDADIAAKTAGTAATVGAEGRAQQSFGERLSPEQLAADEQYNKLQASPFATTPAGRAALKYLAPHTTLGRKMPTSAPTDALADAGAPDPSDAIAEIAADPAIAAIVERATKTAPGMFTGGQGRATGAAARRVAASTIAAKLRQRNVPEDQIQDYITSALGAEAGGGSMLRSAAGAAATGLRMPMIPGGNILANAIAGR